MCAAASAASPNNGDHSHAPETVDAEGFERTEGYDLNDGKASWARRLIIGYQEYLSGLKMGPTCRFDPTCSNYALTAFSRHGIVKGFILTLGRLARCGPWHPGGWDPVPPRRRSTRQH